MCAEFAALSAIPSHCIALQPGDVGLAGQDIHLSAKAGHPERMDDVAAGELEAHRLADRNVNLVGRGQQHGAARVEIAHPPPELKGPHLDHDARLAARRRDGGERGQRPDRTGEQDGDRDARAHIDPHQPGSFPQRHE